MPLLKYLRKNIGTGDVVCVEEYYQIMSPIMKVIIFIIVW